MSAPRLRRSPAWRTHPLRRSPARRAHPPRRFRTLPEPTLASAVGNAGRSGDSLLRADMRVETTRRLFRACRRTRPGIRSAAYGHGKGERSPRSDPIPIKSDKVGCRPRVRERGARTWAMASRRRSGHPEFVLLRDGLALFWRRPGHDHRAVRCCGERRLGRIGESDVPFVERPEHGDADRALYVGRFARIAALHVEH